MTPGKLPHAQRLNVQKDEHRRERARKRERERERERERGEANKRYIGRGR